MKEDLLIKELTNGFKSSIKYRVNNSLDINIDEMVAEALNWALKYTLTVPDDGYFGQIGVMKEVPIRKHDLELFRPKIRAILNDALLKAQSEKLVKSIGSTAAISLIKGVFESEPEEYTWSYHDSYHDKIIVRVEIDRSHFLTIAVHLSSNMLSDVDKIIPAVKQAKQMIQTYGSDFLIQRNY